MSVCDDPISYPPMQSQINNLSQEVADAKEEQAKINDKFQNMINTIKKALESKFNLLGCGICGIFVMVVLLAIGTLYINANINHQTTSMVNQMNQINANQKLQTMHQNMQTMQMIQMNQSQGSRLDARNSSWKEQEMMRKFQELFEMKWTEKELERQKMRNKSLEELV